LFFHELFISLKIKDNLREKPENLIFSQIYNPDHNIETLLTLFSPIIDKLKLNKKIPLKIVHNVKFLSEHYIKECSNEEIRYWYKFLKKLKVDDFIENNKGKFS